MSVQPINLVAYGLTNALQNVFPFPIVSLRVPTTADKAQIGTVWVYKTGNAVYILTSIANNLANWVLLEVGGGAGVFASLTVTPGPISLTGTTTINTAGAAATTIGNATSTTTLLGTVNINNTLAGVTTIGTGGTGAVNIGNVTGNTAVTGTLTTSLGISTTNGTVSAGNTDAAATSSNLQVLKSRTGGVITTGDALGSLIFAGFDGTGYTVGSAITSTSSGTIAATRVAGDLKFFTHADAAGASTLRMTINSAGNVTLAAPDAGTSLTITSGGVQVLLGDVTLGNGDLNINTPGQGINLPGPVQIITGAGAPAGALALAVGDIYINTAGSGVADRMYVATAVGAWTNFVTAA